MKLTISQTELVKVLEITRHAVPLRPANPILTNLVLICECETQQLIITAFDLSLGICAKCICNVETGGEIALSARLLCEVVSHLPTGDITLESGNNQVILTHSSGKCQIQTLNAQEYPTLPMVNGTPVVMSLAKLQQLLRATLFAASKQEAKQVIAGVHFKFTASNTQAAATDGHQLAFASVTILEPPTATEPIEVTVPEQSLVEIEKLIRNVSGECNCTLTIGKAIASFELPNIRVTTRLLEGQYPPYPTLLPQQFDYQFTVDRLAFDAALKRVEIVAENKNNTVKITFDIKNQEATLSTQANDVGGAVESVLIRAKGVSTNKFYIGFNLKYLISALKHISTTQIIIKANRPTTPVIIEPVNGLNQLVLVMPLDLTGTWVAEEIEENLTAHSSTSHGDETSATQEVTSAPTAVATRKSEPATEDSQLVEV